MTDFPTLPTGPLEHASMDYARLREEGLRLLGRLAGAQWTDFNTHDPGITILEQLCYAITDLGYRTAYPVPELLAGGEPWLPGPEAILTTDPVTLADLRRLALDVPGVGNAWVGESADTGVPIYHHAGSGELRLRADPAEPDAAPVRLRGLHRVLVQPTEQLPGEAARAQVAARLHAARGLGTDLEVALADLYPVGLRAALEVDAIADPAALTAELVERIADYLAPRPRFLTLEEARRGGRPLDEILDGPPPGRGFVEALPDRRRTVTVSDLIHAILDVPAVKTVRSLILEDPAAGPAPWVLEIPPGAVPILAPSAELRLHRAGLPLRVDPEDVRRLLGERRARPAELAGAHGVAPPPPRPRDLTRHRSIRYQLPAAYGVGPLGLPSSAPPERHAQARQLAAYLLIFDQLFANALAQLAHARELLSPGEAGDRTYVAAPVADDRLGLDELRVQEPADHRAWLDGAIEAGDPRDRRGRFLAHLLARFAEEPVADPRGFLRDYARSSRARGSGYDVGDAAGSSGFEDRLRHKLGLRELLRLHVVEHVLLRPLPEDRAQLAGEGEPEIPLLAGVAGPDPWSLQISIVMEEPGLAGADLAQLEQLVEQTIRAETPAHLTVHLHWLGDTDGVDHWRAFEDAWQGFRAAHQAYRDAELGRPSTADGLGRERQLRARDARDRVIDLLGLGRTYPLRDLPLPAQIVVAPGTAARIPIGFGQVGVTYELRTREGTPIQGVDGVDGTGGPIELVTPPIDVDATFRILAVKQDGARTSARREAWLATAVHVIEGVDPALVARIRLPVLDPRIDNPRPSDARLGRWRVPAEVEVLASQEGVSYELIEHAADLTDVARHRVVSAQPVIGTSGTIVLRTIALEEDVDLRVRGQRATGTPSDPVIRTGILDLVLPLRLRANPGVPAQVTPSVVAHGGAAVVRLEATQAGTEYRLYRGRVRDRDFVLGAAGGAPTLDVPGDGRTVQLRRPPGGERWEELPDFAPVGDAAGGGGALELPIGAPVIEDTFLLVQAKRRHQLGPLGAGAEEIVSAVQLDRALAVLVRPDPAPALRLAVAMAGGATDGALEVSGGQPGVFYELRLDGEDAPIGRPAYFHQRDDRSAQVNKGIDQLAIEVDAAIARDRPGPAGDPRTTPPAAPRLDTAPLPAGSVLRVRARKAMSGLGVALPRGAVLDDVPAIAAVPASVAPGAPAIIVIAASRPDERYRLLRDGAPAGEEVVGTGAALELPTEPLEARAVFTVAVTRTGTEGLEVERRADVVVEVGEGGEEGEEE